jgi:hypothetical protein
MSWEDVWRLSLPPIDREHVVEALRQAFPELESRVVPYGAKLEIRVNVPKESILDVLRKVDPSSSVFLMDAERLAEEIEPPYDPASPSYTLTMTVDDDTFGVYSNSGDNRRVWAVAHAVFRTLAAHLHAEPVDEEDIEEDS